MLVLRSNQLSSEISRRNIIVRYFPENSNFICIYFFTFYKKAFSFNNVEGSGFGCARESIHISYQYGRTIVKIEIFSTLDEYDYEYEIWKQVLRSMRKVSNLVLLTRNKTTLK